jgi:hypothetical protein
MLINFGQEVEIEDLGNHPAETLMKLQDGLIGGVTVTPDPKRTGFYEFESDSIVYYIHVSPVSGTIFLLATWRNVAASSPELDVAGSARARPA